MFLEQGSEQPRWIPFWDNLFQPRGSWQQQATRALAETALFAHVPRRVLGRLVEGMYHREYEDGEVIFRTGDSGLGMYLVLSGSVTIALEGRPLAELKPGALFGEVALFGDDVRTADALASSRTELVGLFRPELQEWVERSPKLGVKVLQQLGKMLAERLRHTNERLVAAELSK